MTQVQENLYGHTGARVQSTQEGATHTYCYAGGRMLCDDTGSSAVSYLYAGDTVACGYQGEHAYLYMQDQQGSTYGIVREDGAVADTYRYTDFGETEAVTDTGFDNVLCYSGSVYDKVTGLYYLNARYYDLTTATSCPRTPTGERSRTATSGICMRTVRTIRWIMWIEKEIKELLLPMMENIVYYVMPNIPAIIRMEEVVSEKLFMVRTLFANGIIWIRQIKRCIYMCMEPSRS